MKKIFLAAMAAVALCACSTNEQPEASADGNTVTITFTSDLTTRAFFDDTAVAEPWESEVKSMAVYVYDAAGDNLVYRLLSSTELSSGKAIISLPRSTEGTTCSFFAVANEIPGTRRTRAELEGALESSLIYSYNGKFDRVTTGALHSGGFAMSGKTEVNIKPINHVGITLKRTVAKVALRMRLSDDFNSIYNGSVEIKSATIYQQVPTTYLFENGNYTTGTADQSVIQESADNDGYCNLFYVFERPAGDKLTISISGTYYGDNGISKPVTYQIPVEGSGKGLIKRNGYYRLDCIIKGTGNSEVDLTFTVADWETPTTETIELGI